MSFSFSMLMYLNNNHTLSICAAVITIHSCVSFNQTLHLGILLFQGRIFSSNHSKYFNNENWKISINLKNNKCLWILLCCKCTISHKQSQDRNTVVFKHLLWNFTIPWCFHYDAMFIHVLPINFGWACIKTSKQYYLV